MGVVVSAASKHGATAEIAGAIAEALVAAGLDARAVEPDAVQDLDGVDALVIGSAVYAGHWLDGAKDLVGRVAADLGDRPVWLFSSGPVGDPPEPDEDPVDVADLVAATSAREHRLFAGRLDRSKLRFGEKAIVMALRAPEGDFRDWDGIRAWAGGIADQLRTGG